MDFFENQRKRIQAFLRDYLEKKARELGQVNPWGRDACDRLAAFTLGGKMIRGALTALSARMYGFSDPSETLKAGAAIELLQSAFLIHDDIMDGDETRRGEPSLFYQYQRWGEKRRFSDPLLFGQSMGICVGDIAFFLLIDILSGLEVPPAIRQRITGLCAGEIAATCTAQMQDVHWGYSEEPEEEQDILNLYVHKTGRYTFGLPLSVGAILAGQPEETLGTLQRLGERLGIVFQIKDDELGLYGSEEEIGKPVGSDLGEGKKTLFMHYLFKEASLDEREKLKRISASGKVGSSDLNYVRGLLDAHGIGERIGKTLSRYAEEARILIDSLDGTVERYRTALKELLEYLLERRS
jgi:geranylgeranyl diphosphate synthase type I